MAGSLRHCSTPGKVVVKVRTSDGTRVEVAAPVGMTLMNAIRDVGQLDMQGACDGCMECCTCHVYVSPAWYEKVSGSLRDAEQDLLDKTAGSTAESRLACQIKLQPEHEGLEVELPPS